MINKLIRKYQVLANMRLKQANDPSIPIAIRINKCGEQAKIYQNVVADLKALRKELKNK